MKINHCLSAFTALAFLILSLNVLENLLQKEILRKTLLCYNVTILNFFGGNLSKFKYLIFLAYKKPKSNYKRSTVGRI